jgi:hypothetical protein
VIHLFLSIHLRHFLSRNPLYSFCITNSPYTHNNQNWNPNWKIKSTIALYTQHRKIEIPKICFLVKSQVKTLHTHNRALPETAAAWKEWNHRAFASFVSDLFWIDSSSSWVASYNDEIVSGSWVTKIVYGFFINSRLLFFLSSICVLVAFITKIGCCVSFLNMYSWCFFLKVIQYW